MVSCLAVAMDSLFEVIWVLEAETLRDQDEDQAAARQHEEATALQMVIYLSFVTSLLILS